MWRLYLEKEFCTDIQITKYYDFQSYKVWSTWCLLSFSIKNSKIKIGLGDIFIRIPLTYFYAGMRKSEMDETKYKNGTWFGIKI